jgi:hypothetical protein
MKTATVFAFDNTSVQHREVEVAAAPLRTPLPEICFDALDDDAGSAPPVPAGGPVKAEALPAAIEAMPHLVEKLVRLWGTRDLNTLLHEILLDSRDGGRKGFPIDAANELMLLAKINLIIRAEAAAPLLGVGFAEACAMIARGDQAALGHPEFVHDSWGVHGAGVSRRTAAHH